MHTRPQDSTVTPHARTLPIISNLVINTKNVSSEIKIGLAAAASSSSPTLPQQPQFVDRLEPFMPPPPTEESQPTLQDTPVVVPSNIQEDITDSISTPSSEVVGQKRKRTEDATEIELLDGAPPLKTPCLEVCSTAEAVQEVEDSDSAIIKVTKEDFMCTLCRSLLYEPVSPRCGHTFCKQCIFEAISHNNHCPICRVIIHITPEAGVNSLIKDLIIRSFPGQYGKEQLEARAEDEALANANPADLVITIPIFPLEMVLFPFQLLPMQVFKPQYQLMLSRCLEGGGSFGVLSQINGVASQVGTEAVVENHAQLPDGRSLITCRGARRFEVIETSEMEGYPVAKVRYIKDIEERAAEQNDASTTNNTPSPSSQAEVEELYRQMIELTRTKMGGVLPMIEQKFGPMPTNNVEQFSYWLACLLPFPLEKKQAYLQCRSVMERLRIGQDAFNRR